MEKQDADVTEAVTVTSGEVRRLELWSCGKGQKNTTDIFSLLRYLSLITT